MLIEKSQYQAEPSDFKDLGPEFIANKAVVSEQISEIKAMLLRHDERMNRIEEALKPILHIETIQNQLRGHDERMTRIESDQKSVVKDLRIWIGLTASISAAISAVILGIAKFLS